MGLVSCVLHLFPPVSVCCPSLCAAPFTPPCLLTPTGLPLDIKLSIKNQVTDLLHGSAYVQMKFEQEEEGSDFSFHFIKKHDDTGKFVPIFRCQSDKTTVEVRTDDGG